MDCRRARGLELCVGTITLCDRICDDFKTSLQGRQGSQQSANLCGINIHFDPGVSPAPNPRGGEFPIRRQLRSLCPGARNDGVTFRSPGVRRHGQRRQHESCGERGALRSEQILRREHSGNNVHGLCTPQDVQRLLQLPENARMFAF
jgi:hypothetical protein